VALLAGVSPKTASRALNSERYVRDETAQRVRHAADELGFIPNRMARGLKAGTTMSSVALVIADVGNPFWSSVARGVERALDRHGLLLMTVSHEEDVERQARLLRALCERQVDGIVLVPAHGTTDLTGLLRDVPVVALDRPLSAPAADEVLFDDKSGALTAVAALTARGHRHIGMILAESGLWTMEQRLEGYRQAVARAGVDVDPGLIVQDCPDAVSATAAMRDLLRHRPAPTAVLAANAVIARGVLRALKDSDAVVEVVAFDSDPDADLYAIAPSSVVIDPESAGQTAADLLVDRIQASRRPVRRVTLPAALVLRPAFGAAPAEEGPRP
jgi:LacI family transcriptional regulator